MNLYVKDRRAWEDLLSRKRFSERVPKVEVIKHGIILPARKRDDVWAGGVCDEDFNFVAGYSRLENLSGGGFACVCSAYTVKKRNITQLDEDVIFGGSLSGTSGILCLSVGRAFGMSYSTPNAKIKFYSSRRLTAAIRRGSMTSSG